MEYGAWLLSPPQIEAPAANPTEWELKRQALIKAIQKEQATGNDYWQQTWEGADTIEAKDVEQMPWPGVNGWAACDKKRKYCALVIRSTGADYNRVLEHEKKHAAGFDHPKYPLHIEGFQNPLVPLK